MALEQKLFNIGAFSDDLAGGNNYITGEVYEVFNINDTLADIYSDAGGITPITQDGINNKSDSDGQVLFYIADGDYYIKVGVKERLFTVGISLDLINDLSQSYTFPTVVAYKASTILFPLGKNIHLQDRGANFLVIADTLTANTFNIIASDSVNQSVELIVGKVFNVMDFGAKGIGSAFDDAPAIQASIDLAAVEGGTVVLPKPSNYYSLQTTRTTTTAKESCLIIPEPSQIFGLTGQPVSLLGLSPNTPIRVESPVLGAFSALFFEGTSLYKRLENIDLWGGTSVSTPLVDHIIYGADAYHPNMTITACRFYVAIEDCVRLATYVTTMTNVQTAYSKRGFKIAGPNEVLDVTTALTMNSCYALEHSENGYWFGNTTYCTLNSCAADNIESFPYRFGIARGVTMNACGAESSPTLIKIITVQGFVMNAFSTLSIGDDTTPPEALIDIEGGTSATLSGLHLQNAKAYGYKLKVGAVFQAETISVLDSSIKVREVLAPSNLANSNPVKFLVWDTSNRDYTWPITNTQDIVDALSSFENTEQNHVQTLQLPDGDLVIDQAISRLITRVYGSGSIIFKGGTASRLVVGGSNKFYLGDTPVTLDVVFKDVDLHMNVLSGITQGFVFEGRNTRFENANITSHDTFVQYAIIGKCGMTFDSSSQALTGFLSSGTQYSVTLAPTAISPTGKYPNRSIAYKDDPDATEKGWIRGTGGWFVF